MTRNPTRIPWTRFEIQKGERLRTKTLLAGVTVAVALLSGCSRPSFTGRLYAQLDRAPPGAEPQGVDVIEFARGAPEGEIQRKVIVSGALVAAVSPAGTHLAYSMRSPSGVYIRDLRTDETTRITYNTADCLSWSPAGDRLAFSGDGDLYLAALRGGLERLLAAPAGPYEHYKDYALVGRSWEHGQMDCPTWLSADRLIVNRYIGDLPKSIGSIGAGSLEPNAITILKLGNPTSITNRFRKFKVLDVCPNQPLFLLQQHCITQLSREFHDFETANGTVLSSNVCLPARFAPPDCRIYYLEDDQLKFPDPVAPAESRTVALGSGHWMFPVFHPDGRLLAVTASEDGKSDTECRIRIVDVGTGRGTVIAREKRNKATQGCFRLLAWNR